MLRVNVTFISLFQVNSVHILVSLHQMVPVWLDSTVQMAPRRQTQSARAMEMNVQLDTTVQSTAIGQALALLEATNPTPE